MEYSNERQYNIIGYRKLWFFISGTLIAISVAVVALWGLKLGIDFTGGSLVEIEFKDNRPVVKDVESAVPEQLGKANIAPLGDRGMALRLRSLSEDEHQQLLASLKEKLGKDKDDDYLNESRFTSIGPTIGAELQQKAVWAIAIVLLAIILYIAWAFRKVSRPVPSWQYGVAAVMALFHDVFIPVGIFAALGHFMGVEIDTLFITALLTVLGFSVHDTIVVFDRIRENLLKPAEQFAIVVNKSVNETLARSINTSLATLLVLITTLIFGGETIRYFVLTLILGIIFGTYSSIFIASPLLVSANRWTQKRREAKER
ncbi:protein-export membrane protein SecF [Candidatus Uhrbacteria bacterium RIFCSPLOWO2_12_FULL_46_10]|uniref:Protein-export membrane protein SecF n=1 Tax=Candidatus Uhrbacteria bacterium RIFCSPLOWO2_01_FULL_47_25 TaxID=1802402 RepID=A0A1F7UY63_9BACT|nr:MAG: Protein translocase subunit SecF [Parcubacteria group bacterium GW2011_GWA2_46_9]OGL76356.1 MAG: protein-export membrane protein SecF [Candidatus Uhrbacteria bacterium RIFCSPHIGHO2_12_FULL_46_13]OGL82698.1 MAG: protein-export membrane protein SecF [Candidatus Uhrbacteria bacterium RIFCSPLOWO2_01_FULL_47_25]OGL85906.1 MAG: protein-export membrane protein SecF [Candidatus Uhrbacteria bacterium RIFCSPLOWO2_02_FULL_46_19]OGL91046.1 MAG: protein-export membrane protein SecF [Candidatus Uhrba